MTPEQAVAAMPHVRAAVAAGLLAFPVKLIGRIKKPAETGWQRKVWDLGMLEQALQEPKCMGYGLTLPKADPRRIVDLDLDDGGEGLQPGQTSWQERLAEVEREHGALPPTKTTETPSGGQHRWFLWPDDVPLPGGSWNGFTTRVLHGSKNYVVGPGSMRDGKPYVNAAPGTPIATMPIDLARSGVKGKHNGASIIEIKAPYQLPETIAHGDCHIQVCRYTLSLWTRRHSLAEMWTLVLHELGPKLATKHTEEHLREHFDSATVELATKYPRDADGYSLPVASLLGGSVGVNSSPAHAAKPPAHLTRQSRAAWYFAQMAGDQVRFDHGRGRWLLWAGHRWQPDEDGAIERLWLDALADRYRTALTIVDNDVRVKTLDAIQSAGATNAAVSAGLELASSMTPIATKADAWDPDPWVLGCENGVVDLRTGLLRPGRPEEMISRSTGIAYDPDARCPRWVRFLIEVFAGDEALADWYALLIGTSLVGEVQELLAIHHGLGNNGKSVGVRALRHAIGEYAVTIPVETLVNAKRSAGEATPDLMALRGARIAFTSEPDQAAKLRGGVLKRLATVDRMTGRSLFGQTQSWDPTHSVNLMTNHLPAVDDATEGFWRRVALIPWTVRFRKPGETGDALAEDPDLAATLAQEGPGILAWAVRGAVAYARGKTLHPFPASVRVRTAAYRADEDKLGAFVAERVIYEPDASVAVGVLFVAYKAWCDAQSVPTFERLGQKLFARGFEERGHGVGRALGRWALFTGARLADEHEVQALQASEPFAGSSEIPLHIESSGNRPQVPAMPAEDPPADLWTEAQHIFAADLIEAEA